MNQVDALTLRQISGGFSGSHRSPSQSSSNYLLLDPPTLVSKITAQKKILGHRNAVYCGMSSHSLDEMYLLCRWQVIELIVTSCLQSLNQVRC